MTWTDPMARAAISASYTSAWPPSPREENIIIIPISSDTIVGINTEEISRALRSMTELCITW